MKQYQDLKHQAFISKLIPNLPKESFIGIKMGVLKKIAKEMDLSFLDQLPHQYYEENMVHALMINNLKDVVDCYDKVQLFCPFLDNWSVVDSFYPKALTKDKELFNQSVNQWLRSDHEYTVRFALNLLRIYDLKQGLLKVIEIKHQGYYVKMMQAWLICDGLIKHYEIALDLLKKNKLDAWVHNKSIQKAVESFRINNETKEYLKTLKVK